MLSDLVWRNTGDHIFELVGKFTVMFQYFTGLYASFEKRPDNLVVHGRTCNQAAVFGRIGRCADQPPGLGIFDQEISIENSSIFHDWISPVPQKDFILRKQVMLPQMSRQPSTATYP